MFYRIRKSGVYGKAARNQAAWQWAVSSLYLHPLLDSRNEVIPSAREIIQLATLQIPWVKQGVSRKLRWDNSHLVAAFQVESFPSSCFQIEGQVFILQLKCRLHISRTQSTGVQTKMSLDRRHTGDLFSDRHESHIPESAWVPIAPFCKTDLGVPSEFVSLSLTLLRYNKTGIRPSHQHTTAEMVSHAASSLLYVFGSAWVWPGLFCPGLLYSKETKVRFLSKGFCSMNWNPHFSSLLVLWASHA